MKNKIISLGLILSFFVGLAFTTPALAQEERKNVIQITNLEENQVVKDELLVEGLITKKLEIQEVKTYLNDKELGIAKLESLEPEGDINSFNYKLDTKNLEEKQYKVSFEVRFRDETIERKDINIQVENTIEKDENIEVKENNISGTKEISIKNVNKNMNPKTYIDSPVYNAKIKNSDIKISGWALNGSGVKEVQILVDGKEVGKAEIGISRADVDLAYPGYPGGKESGFSYTLDKNRIPTGRHKIEVKSIGVDGSIDVKATVVNVEKPTPRSYIDNPVYNTKIKNSDIKISGWALNSSGVKEVQVLVDGKEVGKAKIGISRADVDLAYPGYPGGKESGFSYTLDKNRIPTGRHKIEVKSIGVDGSIDVKATVVNVEKPTPRSYIDNPVSNKTIKDRDIKVSGWSLNSSGIKEVQVLVNGTEVGKAEMGILRSDVDKAYPGYVGGKESGFSYILDKNRIATGRHKIEIRSIGNDGSIDTKFINVNIEKPRPRTYIDSLTNNQRFNPFIQGNIKVSGWSLNSSGVKEVQVLINGTEVGKAEIGILRSDVDKAYPGYKDGDKSGFNYILDRNKLKIGINKITIKTIGVDGSIKIENTIINWIKPQSRLYIDSKLNVDINNYSGKYLNVNGWALNGSGVKEVQVLVNGKEVGKAEIGISRADVDRAYPGYKDGDKSGFKYNLEVEKIKSGLNTISIKSIGNDGTSIIKNVNVGNHLLGKTIMLDPGHGGKDSGAINGYLGIKEKNHNNSLTYRIYNKLTKLGAKVIFTRKPDIDEFVHLHDRTAMANKEKPDLLISIHHDSSTNKLASGMSVHYSSYRPGLNTSGAYVIYNGKEYKFVKEIRNWWDPVRKVRDPGIVYLDGNKQKTANINDVIVYDNRTPSNVAIQSKKLADKLYSSLLELDYNRVYSYKRDHNLHMTRWTNIPSALIEAGFISNNYEAIKVVKPAVQDKIAQKVVDAINSYFNN